MHTKISFFVQIELGNLLEYVELMEVWKKDSYKTVDESSEQRSL
jgi:hypothetical protein